MDNRQVQTPSYMLFPDLSVLSDSTENKKLAHIIDNASLAMPDGKPSEFIARLKGYKEVSTVSGYKLIKRLLAESNRTHFFYGSTREKIKKMEEFLYEYCPDSKKILGFKEAPFVGLDEIEFSNEIKTDLEKINELKPDFVWIGLSSPKQDYLLYHHHSILKNSYCLGVGGVFDYLSGEVKISPDWIKKVGLRWLFRLVKEPKRLFPKYWKIVTNLCKYSFKRSS
ncbi:MAG: WecB/TagA/CpsF family glycosyltransferase [Balneola sp.]